ncbi:MULTISPECIES: hypothetical protein [unclassified Mesorhizobium]|uniref:hypothetical protein n=1 Tax=unclassified Mesorhizobium TaxID=325217 RepID=UPI000FCA97AC|nr:MULTISPECIES: hypothetical protein [unclassified Mesorhizobium]RUX96136.1 hypothetical protein EN993_08830 [Mesorhizobium sp. M7D.F.Ca.US.004.01.2.1]RVA32550.1 hypothetical protein EN935_11750 [Mesorhizobium sp. M7D.F.Ca.US.004.03.1.1]
MARKCRANAYLVELRGLYAKSSENLKFGKFDGGTDLRTAIQKILSKMTTFSKIPLHQKVFSIEPKWGKSGPLIGFLKAGDYGFASDIIDTDNGKVAYNKKKTESLPDPFYFHLELPDNEKRGILCIQSWGLSGVRSLFETAISGQFDKLYPAYRLHIRSLTVADALAEYLKVGSVEEVIVEKHEIPADIADRFGGNKTVQPGKFVYSIQPSDKGMFKRDGLIAFAKGEKKLEEVFDFDDNGFDVVKTRIRVGGELKTINLTKPENLSTSYDLTADVKIGQNGFPTFESLKSEFVKIVDDLAKRGGIEL